MDKDPKSFPDTKKEKSKEKHIELDGRNIIPTEFFDCVVEKCEHMGIEIGRAHV